MPFSSWTNQNELDLEVTPMWLEHALRRRLEQSPYSASFVRSHHWRAGSEEPRPSESHEQILATGVPRD